MSTNLRTATTPNETTDVQLTSYNGGSQQGRMLQLTQRGGAEIQIIHADREQVAQMIQTMQEWLGSAS